MLGLMHPVGTWICRISFRGGYIGLFFLLLLLLLNCLLFVAIQPGNFLWAILCQCLSELVELFQLLCYRGRSTPTRCSKRQHLFSVTFPRSYMDVQVNSFFPCTAITWNYMHSECFSLTYYINGFKCRVNRRLFAFGFSLFGFPFCFSSLSLFSCNYMHCPSRHLPAQS